MMMVTLPHQQALGYLLASGISRHDYLGDTQCQHSISYPRLTFTKCAAIVMACARARSMVVGESPQFQSAEPFGLVDGSVTSCAIKKEALDETKWQTQAPPPDMPHAFAAALLA